MKTKIKDITPCFKFSKHEPYFSAKTDYCSEGLARFPKRDNLAGLFGKTNTDAIDFFIVFSDKFGSVIISVGLALLLNKLFGLIT